MSPESSCLLDRIRNRSLKTPQLPAVVFPRGSLTYGELYRGICRTAAGLRSLGIRSGDRVIVALPNGKAFFSVFYGIMGLGGIGVPLFPGSSRERIENIASVCGARMVIGETPPGQDHPKSSIRWMTPGAIIDSDDGREPGFPGIDPGETAYIQYTSGSTSDPRGVMVSHRGLVTNLKQMIEGFFITGDDVFVSWLPTYHDMGLVLMTMVPFYMGIPLVLLQATLTNVRHWITAIGIHRGTFTAAPDFAYRLALTYIQNPEDFDLSSLRVALNAAEPVRIATIREFEQRFGLGPVMTPAYGLAEATVGVSTWDPGRPVITDEKSFVSVGKPFPGIEIRIDNGGSGKVGEILVRSPANASGYWDNAPANDELFTDDGFIRTGDLGYMDRDCHLFIVGREKNIIIHGGRNISPKEIEEIIDPLPFVRTSAAFGDDSDRRSGEQVCIFVEIRKDRMGSPGEWEDILIVINRAFHDYFGFRPGKIFLVKPGTIPCTPNRKVKYTELRDRYIGGYYRSGGDILYPEF